MRWYKRDKEEKKSSSSSDLEATKLGESYSWISDWTCPICDHHHTKPHFAFPDQVNFKKQSNEEGRVKKNRESKDSVCEAKHGPIEIKGKQQPMFCPHCGWLDELLYIIKV
jgi:hypothetical protein